MQGWTSWIPKATESGRPRQIWWRQLKGACWLTETALALFEEVALRAARNPRVHVFQRTRSCQRGSLHTSGSKAWHNITHTLQLIPEFPGHRDRRCSGRMKDYAWAWCTRRSARTNKKEQDRSEKGPGIGEAFDDLEHFLAIPRLGLCPKVEMKHIGVYISVSTLAPICSQIIQKVCSTIAPSRDRALKLKNKMLYRWRAVNSNGSF